MSNAEVDTSSGDTPTSDDHSTDDSFASGDIPTSDDPSTDDGRPLATDAERKALASVLRLKILRMCLYEPLTNREIALNLGRNPASILHHVRTLVNNGFLTAEPARRGTRGAREVPYRATGKSWRLRYPEGANESMRMLQTFLDEIAGMPPEQLNSSRLGLALSPEHLREFNDRLHELLNEFATRPHDPDGRRFSVFFAMHPERWSVGRPSAEGENSAE